MSEFFQVRIDEGNEFFESLFVTRIDSRQQVCDFPLVVVRRFHPLLIAN